MTTITENINALKKAKTDIHDAIEAKGQSLDGVPFTKYAEKITEIQGGGGGSVGGEKAKEIATYTVTEINPQDITDVGMTEVRNYQFISYRNLLKFISTKEQKISVGSYSFDGCTGIKEISIDKVRAGSQSFFRGCSSLKKLVIFSGGDLANRNSFVDCTSLQVVDLSGLTAVPNIHPSSAFTNVPSTCKIIIPKSISVEDWKSSTNWANWADKLIFENASE